MYQLGLLACVACILTWLAPSGALARSKNSLPFWTEKTTYVEGDRLYAVGISGSSPDQAVARDDAFRRAQIELLNFLQLSDISPLVIETQMNHETELDKRWKSYRLVWVDYAKALELKQAALASQSQAVRHHTQFLRERIGALEPLLQEHKTALEQLKALEREADTAAKELRSRLKLAKPASDALKSKIEARTLLTCLVSPGMRQSEVESLLGRPDSVHANGRTWHYGKSSLVFLSKKVRGVVNYSECRQAKLSLPSKSSAPRIAIDDVSSQSGRSEIL